MADLYSKLAQSYDKPSAADLENLGISDGSFYESKGRFARDQEKDQRFGHMELMDFKEFLKPNKRPFENNATTANGGGFFWCR